MGTCEFHHFGVPTRAKQNAETYIAGAKVFVTDPEAHPYRVEFLRFESDSPMPEAIRTQSHAAFVVPRLEEALKGRKVLIEPFEATDSLRVAFIADGDAVIELMEKR